MFDSNIFYRGPRQIFILLHCNNCKPDNGEILNVDVLIDNALESDSVESVTIMDENDYNETTSNSNNFSPVSNNSPSIENEKVSLEICSVAYFVGYLAKTRLIQFLCKDWEITFTRNKHYLNVFIIITFFSIFFFFRFFRFDFNKEMIGRFFLVIFSL